MQTKNFTPYRFPVFFTLAALAASSAAMWSPHASRAASRLPGLPANNEPTSQREGSEAAGGGGLPTARGDQEEGRAGVLDACRTHARVPAEQVVVDDEHARCLPQAALLHMRRA